MAICTEKTMYINIENTGKFPLHYFLQLVEHPSVIYMTKLWPLEIGKKKPIITEALTKKIRRGMKTDKYASFFLFFNYLLCINKYIYIYLLYIGLLCRNRKK